jgi:acetylornithine/LysW-gamma-L-lysine aminotransferase
MTKGILGFAMEILKDDTMNSLEIQSLELRHTSGVYTKRPVVIIRGKGAHLWDAEGKEYIDCVGGQGAANLGHANLEVAQAIAAQAQTLILQ